MEGLLLIETALYSDPDFEIYHISYLWYTLLGCTITMVTALIASFATGVNDPQKMDQMLLAPFVRTILNRNRRGSNKDDIVVGTEDDVRFASHIEIKELTNKN